MLEFHEVTNDEGSDGTVMETSYRHRHRHRKATFKHACFRFTTSHVLTRLPFKSEVLCESKLLTANRSCPASHCVAPLAEIAPAHGRPSDHSLTYRNRFNHMDLDTFVHLDMICHSHNMTCDTTSDEICKLIPTRLKAHVGHLFPITIPASI